MICVSIVSYSVLVNGEAFGNVTPTRGIRQGDLLFPLLFILCSEMLANGLRQSEQAGRLTGIQLGSTGPAISHLLFADDSIFFAKATLAETIELKSVLSTYEKLSGQKINLSKSSITFGNKVKPEKKDHVHQALQSRNQGGQGIYLGLPKAFIGSKIATLNYLEKRVANKINSSKNRFLSQGGKETLIKAVALALPTYTMSCFKLPKKTINKITSQLARFWWRHQDTAKGIHWTAWDKMTSHKRDGGLGFRDIERFNQALLGKQFSRLVNNQHSLLAQVLKSSYYPKNSILEASVGFRPSFGWRSLIGTKTLMAGGLKKEFGGGSTIDILKDP